MMNMVLMESSDDQNDQVTSTNEMIEHFSTILHLIIILSSNNFFFEKKVKTMIMTSK